MSDHDNVNAHAEEMMTYPTNRLTCYFEKKEDFQQAMREFAGENFDISDIYVLQGQEGIEVLDIDGSQHGILARISRLVQSVMADSEIHEFELMREHLEQGHIVIAVHTPEQYQRDTAQRIMHNHNGHHITFFSRFYVETIEE